MKYPRPTALALIAALAAPPSARADGARPALADVIATLQSAVVNIAVTIHEIRPPAEGNMSSQPTVSDTHAQSSGFFVLPSGIIITNRHAVEGASEIIVTLHDATRLRACVLATAAQSDIALLKVNAGKPVPTVTFGDSDGLHPGDPVFVIGNPLGLGSTVTAGIVSALDRVTPQSRFGAFFQIDASLNHGSSGGPVFDAAGGLVGVATALFTPGGETGSVGLGLAIPARDAKFIAERLLTDGQVHLGWIGAHVEPVTADIAGAVGLPAATGSIITDVDDDSPAIRAGLASGDVILRVDERQDSRPLALNLAIARTPVGAVVRLAVWRDGLEQTLPIVVGESPADQRAAAQQARAADCATARSERHDLGLVVGAITEDLRGKLGLKPSQAGAQVIDVGANTVAADRGVQPGWVILNVQRRPVRVPQDVQAGIDAAREAKAGAVLMLIRSAQGQRWLALPLTVNP